MEDYQKELGGELFLLDEIQKKSAKGTYYGEKISALISDYQSNGVKGNGIKLILKP